MLAKRLGIARRIGQHFPELRMKSVTLLFTWLLLTATAHLSVADELPKSSRVVLVGDSTVTDSAGWGGAFARRLGPESIAESRSRRPKLEKFPRRRLVETERWSKSLITC